MSEKKVGKCAVFYGPMCGGKSLELVRHVHLFKPGWDGPVIMVVKSGSIRMSGEECVESRSGARLRAGDVNKVISCNRLADVGLDELLKQRCIIAIDEGHFFPDLKPMVEKLMEWGHFVMVAGLDLDWRGNPFGGEYGILRILELVPEIQKRCKAVCAHCACLEGVFSAKRHGKSKEVLEVGLDQYVALCRACWLRRDELGFMIE